MLRLHVGIETAAAEDCVFDQMFEPTDELAANLSETKLLKEVGLIGNFPVSRVKISPVPKSEDGSE